MVFSSLVFLCIFLPAVLLLYNVSKNITYKNIILVIASLFFYAWGEPTLVLILAISILMNYIYGRLIDVFYGKTQSTVVFVISVVTNLGALAVFKYLGFFIENINSLLGTEIANPQISLPLGISFYTFQTLSYIIDLYKGKTKVQKSIISFAAYVSMFPQLVAGPIVRYSDIAAELKQRRVTANDFAEGILRFCVGLCKKVIIANNAGNVASLLLDSPRLAVGSAWLGILMYTFQIYFDFSSYSDMAIGLGRMFGFHFNENFNYPYISRSITDFWRRWHISLSTFFRDYVYIPLGGNRYRPIRNLFIVWFLTGMWHGASWNFILWGLFYGIILFIEKTSFKQWMTKIPRPFCYIYTMFIVMIGWALFYYTDTDSLFNFMQCAFGTDNSLYDLVTVTTFCNNLWLIILCIIASTPIPSLIFNKLCAKNRVFAAIMQPLLVACAIAICFILLVGQTYNPFLYFRF